jgi:hypothetical protein
MSVEVWPISHRFLVLQLSPQPKSSIEVMNAALQKSTASSVVLENINSPDGNKENVAPQVTSNLTNMKVYSANKRPLRFLLANLNGSIKRYLKMKIPVL